MTRMETNRRTFHELLRKLLGSDQVYYQRPENKQMKYPAIVYSRDEISNGHADNCIYKQEYVYAVTVIDPNPDSVAVDKVSKIPRTRFVRHYTQDRLNHDLFTIYF